MDPKRIWGVAILTATLAIVFSLLAAPGSILFNNVGIAYGANSVTATSTVNVTSTAPVLSTVNIYFLGYNNTSRIVLTPNQTTSVSVNTSVTDYNGCSDLTGASSSVLLYRSGIGSSTCSGGAASNLNLNCYVASGTFASVFTNVGACTNSTTENVTTTFGVYYFAQATDASSSFNGQNWVATVIVTSGPGKTGTGDSTNNTSSNKFATLNAIAVSQASINYGSVGASQNTGATNQQTTIANAGNYSTTFQVYANPTLSLNGANSVFLATSSQQYATTSFTYNNASATALTGSAVTVTGFILTAPTTTTNVSGTAYWGIGIASGTATGSYSGVNQFNSLYTN